MIDYQTLKTWKFPDVKSRYTERDVMLYALSLGFGSDPSDPKHLRFTYEKDLQVVPSMASILGHPGFFWDKAGVDWVKIVHAEQDVVWYDVLPSKGSLVAKNRVENLTDLGEERGAIAKIARDIYHEESGDLLATSSMITLLRGDGGFSKGDGIHDAPIPKLPTAPSLKPDMQVELKTLPQSALLYRLNGDYNPLHCDPEVSSRAGFSQPILHGLCSYGMATRVIVQHCCDGDASRLHRFAVKFTAPVFPGETIRFDIWVLSERLLRLRAVVVEREQVVLNNGVVDLH